MQKAILSGAVPSSIFSPQYVATKHAGPGILKNSLAGAPHRNYFRES